MALRLLPLVLILVSACEGQPAITYSSAAPNAGALSLSFDADPTGQPPSSGEVFSGMWAVRAEADAPSRPNALCQVGQAEFPAIALSTTVYGDLTATVRFKPISGREDQAAGIIFRVQDKNDYYILRANALESNVNLYKYAGARRSTIKAGAANVASSRWQELRVEVTGERMRGFLDGRLVVETTDTTYKAGRVGLWTKADSVTCFDDVVVTPAASAAPTGTTGVARATAIPTPATATDPSNVTIVLAEHFFSPPGITVQVGTTVTWRNVGLQPHDVNARNGSFRSALLARGDTYSYTFSKPGRYPYFCVPHEGDGMTGHITVE